MVELRWAESAVIDLEEICNYIAKDNEEYARNLLEELLIRSRQLQPSRIQI